MKTREILPIGQPKPAVQPMQPASVQPKPQVQPPVKPKVQGVRRPRAQSVDSPRLRGQSVAIVSMLLYGEPGSGKTESIQTLLGDYCDDVVVLAADPESVNQLNQMSHKIHYIEFTSRPEDATNQLLAAFKSLKDFDSVDQGDLRTKNSSRDVGSIITLAERFAGDREVFSDRDGTNLGPISTWGERRAVILDSLSGCADYINESVGGDKMSLGLPEFRTAVDAERRVWRWMLKVFKGPVIFITHVRTAQISIKKGKKDVESTRRWPSGVTSNSAKVLAGKVSDVVMATCHTTQETGKTTYAWHTSGEDFEINGKARNFKPATQRDMPQDFGPWLKRVYENRSHPVTTEKN